MNGPPGSLVTFFGIILRCLGVGEGSQVLDELRVFGEIHPGNHAVGAGVSLGSAWDMSDHAKGPFRLIGTAPFRAAAGYPEQSGHGYADPSRFLVLVPDPINNQARMGQGHLTDKYGTTY